MGCAAEAQIPVNVKGTPEERRSVTWYMRADGHSARLARGQ